jgi:hypothetical protein
MYPTSAWTPGNIYQESYFVSPPADVPEGNYSIGIGLYTVSGEQLVPDNKIKDHYAINRVPIGTFSVINNQTETYRKMPDYLKK